MDAYILSQFGIDPTGFFLISRARGKEEYHGPCWSDVCRTDASNRDRMTVTLGAFKHTEIGLFRCRRCQHSGRLDDLIKKSSDIDWKSIRKEQRERQKQAKVQFEENKAKMRLWIKNNNIVERYHEQIWGNPEALEYLAKDGIGEQEINYWKIGYNPRFRYVIEGVRKNGPAISFPIIWNDECVNIRMRIMEAKFGDKYRPVRGGLDVQFLNATIPGDDRVFIVEGEKKAIILHKYGIPAIGLYGVEVWRPQWGQWLSRTFKVRYVLFDNEANEGVIKASEKICNDAKAKCLWVPGKPDDFLIEAQSVIKFFDSMKGVPSGKR